MTQEQLDKIKAIEKQMAQLQKQLEEVLNSPKEVWKPRGRHTITSYGVIDNIPSDSQNNFIGTFLTREQAVKAKPQLRAFAQLLAYVAEFDSEWKADWNDKYQEKWTVYFDHFSQKWCSISFCASQSIQVYMSEQCARELADKLNTGEVVLW